MTKLALFDLDNTLYDKRLFQLEVYQRFAALIRWKASYFR